MNKVYEKKIVLNNGREIILETGKLARQADGAIVLKTGNTMLLATVVSAKEARDGIDFMPLSVDYQEKYASAGRFPGGFLKREGRPNDSEILTARLVDRALRPLFPKDYHADTFVNISLISADKDITPDSLAGLAASAALTVSNIPFNGPISEVRVVRIDGKFQINPSFDEVEIADIDMVVAATMDNIMMVEGEMSEVSEDDMLEAIKIAHEEIKKQCQAQIELAEMIGVERREYLHEDKDEELKQKISESTYNEVYEVAKSCLSKKERQDAFNNVKENFIESLNDEEIDEKLVGKYFHDVEKEAVRDLLLNENIRLDGRKPDEIRPIWSEISYLPTAHGSAVFTRGETQSLTTVTLGTKLDEKLIDDALIQRKEKFLLHYNFPPFSTGDARPVRGVGRREVGHGNLAHRALKRMLPNEEELPYTLRIVSDILESNGSSSMATVCAGTLALMDAGVKIKNPVSGIAMGLIVKDEKYAILSDILGDEDHLGDMDFKVTGTENGITACQMDIKVNGLPYEVLSKALKQAKEGRFHILNKMLETIQEPREDYKPFVPRVETIIIPKDLIGAVIGPGGKTIQEIQSNTNTDIVIEEKNGKGYVMVSGKDKESMEKALIIVRGITEEPEVGSVYNGVVKSVVPFGAFVEILPGKQGLLHISEIEWRRLESVEEVLKEGDSVDVKIIGFEKRTKKLKLSRKVLIPKNK